MLTAMGNYMAAIAAAAPMIIHNMQMLVEFDGLQYEDKQKTQFQ